jgi:hypothetical protein
MDFWTSFWIAIFVGLATWIAFKLGYENIGASLGLISTADVMVPLIIITITGLIKMNQAVGPDQMAKTAAETIDYLITWFANNVVSIIAGDLAGMVLGGLFSLIG